MMHAFALSVLADHGHYEKVARRRREGLILRRAAPPQPLSPVFRTVGLRSMPDPPVSPVPVPIPIAIVAAAST